MGQSQAGRSSSNSTTRGERTEHQLNDADIFTSAKTATNAFRAEYYPGEAPFRGSSQHEIFRSKVSEASRIAVGVQDDVANTISDLFGDDDFIELVEPDAPGNNFWPDHIQFNSSLSAIQAAAGAQKRGTFDFWLNVRAGVVSSPEVAGWFAGGSLGADYMFSPQLIGGLGLVFDRVTLEDRQNTEILGNGWIAVPYLKGDFTDSLSYKLQAGYGRVTNEYTPAGGAYTDIVNGQRLLLNGSLTGSYKLGDLTFSPTASLRYFSQEMEAFTDGQGIEVPTLSSGNTSVSLSPSLSRTFDLEGMDLTVGGKLQLSAGMSNTNGVWAYDYLRDGAGLDLSLALPGGATFRGSVGVNGVVFGDIFTAHGSVGLSAPIN